METVRAVWKEPVKVGEPTNSPHLETFKYVEFNAIKANSALIEIKELDTIIPEIKAGFIELILAKMDKDHMTPIELTTWLKELKRTIENENTKRRS